MGMGNIFGQASQDLKKPIGAFRCSRVTKKTAVFFQHGVFLTNEPRQQKSTTEKDCLSLLMTFDSHYIYIYIFFYLDIYVFFFCCWKCFS